MAGQGLLFQLVAAAAEQVGEIAEVYKSDAEKDKLIASQKQKIAQLEKLLVDQKQLDLDKELNSLVTAVETAHWTPGNSVLKEVVAHANIIRQRLEEHN